MASIYSKLIGVDCSQYRLRKNFYLELLKVAGINTARLTPTTVLNTSQEVLDDIQLLEHADAAEFNGVAEKLLNRWPTNIRVLITIGSFVPRGYPRTVFALAARQLAAKPTAAMRKAIAGTQAHTMLGIVGLDMLIDSYAHVEDYAAIVASFDEAEKHGPLVFVFICLQTVTALVDHRSDHAPRLFDYAAESLYELPDPVMQATSQLARLARHFYLRGEDQDFIALLTKSQRLVETLDDLLIQSHLLDFDMRIPGFAAAMRVQHSERERTDALLKRELPEVPLHELTRDQYVEALVEESVRLADHERRIVLMGLANDFPDSMWPWLGLVDISKSPQELLTYAEGGLLRGKRFEAAEFVHDNIGEYWGIIEARPYIRLLINKALALQGLGQLEECIKVLDRILVLDTDDGTGARFMLPSILIRTRQRDNLKRANALLQENTSDAGEPMHDWMQLLLHIINQQPSRVIDVAFQAAMASSIHIGYVLSGMPVAQFKHQFGKLHDTEELALREFIHAGVAAWETYPDAMKMVTKLIKKIR